MDGPFYVRMLLAALVIVGVWNLMGPDELFGFAGNWLEKHAPQWGKPLGLCPPCMASTFGTAVWLITGGEWTGIPIFILALSGALVMVSRKLL